MKKLIFFMVLLATAIYYIGGYNKPKPKMGTVLFDMPNLINKNIDEVMKIYNKSPYKYIDSVAAGSGVYKNDENSEYMERRPIEEYEHGSFIYQKDGWVLGTYFNFKSRKIESIYLAVEDEKFRRISFDDVNDLLIIGNLKTDAEDYSLNFRDWFHVDVELPSEKKHPTYSEVTIYPKYESLNYPKNDTVIFNVPDLIHKNIDQVMGSFGKATDKYSDSISNSGYLHKKYKNPEYSLRTDTGKGTFSYRKDGWIFSASFNLKSKKIGYVYISVESVEFEGFDNVDDLLIVGNLKNVVDNYKLVFSDKNHQDSEFPSKDYRNYYAITIYPKIKKR